MTSKKRFKSVWDALEADPVERENMKLRAQLMIEIRNYVESSGLTQTKAAQKLGTTQPRLSDVINGRIEKCSIDRLINMLASIGQHVDIKVHRAA